MRHIKTRTFQPYTYNTRRCGTTRSTFTCLIENFLKKQHDLENYRKVSTRSSSRHIMNTIRKIFYSVEVLDQFWPPIVPCYSTEDTVRIVNSFITIPITRNYTYNYLVRCVTSTQLTNPYTFVTTFTYSTLARIHSLRALHSNLYCTIAYKVS
jgi:hypothetical protein